MVAWTPLGSPPSRRAAWLPHGPQVEERAELRSSAEDGFRCMNETDWLACKDPRPMLEFLNERATDRKLRLIACAIVRDAPFAGNGRTIWDLLPEFTWFGTPTLNCQTVVESAERYADGL